MRTITTIVIGAGHAGLAMSRCLAGHGIDHVVLERGEVANSWRTERWDSLRLLTPNWQSRLPGFAYAGDDPDGFRTMPEVIAFLDRYAHTIAAPVQTHTRVTSVRRTDAGYLVSTNRGDWHCRTLVLASGACNVASVPRVAAAVPSSIRTLTPMAYRNPDQLEDGGVLVVGASATGIQLADEIQRSGRPVTLAVGEHIRAPRIYRGRDIQWWMDATGVHDQRYDEIDDIARARSVPSLQLVGSPARTMLDLNALTAIGVRLVGRLAGDQRRQAQFSGSLRNQCALSDLKMGRLLDTIDHWATEHGLDGEIEPPHRFPPTGSRRRRRSASISRAARSRPSSGPPATAPTTPGSTSRSSIARAGSVHDGGVVDVARPLRDGPAVPPPPQVRPDRRRRRRRPRPQRPPHRLSEGPGDRKRRLSRLPKRSLLPGKACLRAHFQQEGSGGRQASAARASPRPRRAPARDGTPCSWGAF